MSEIKRAKKKTTTKKKTSSSLTLNATEKALVKNYRKCNNLAKLLIRTLAEKLSSGTDTKSLDLNRLINPNE